MNEIEQRLEAKIDGMASSIREETRAAFSDMRQFTEFVVERSEVKLREEMNARVDEVNARVDAVSARVDAVNDKIDARFNAVERRFDRLEERLFRDRSGT